VTTPGAQSLFASLKVQGSPLGVEIVEYQGVDRRAAQPRLQDPGAAVITFTVRDLDGIVARARRAGIRISTTGGTTGTPTAAARGGRMVILQDPDGFFVALAQPFAVPETLAPASSNIVASRFDVMIADTGRTARLYEQGLGFQMSGGTSSTASALRGVAGTLHAQIRSSSAQIAGTATTIGFHEFSGIDRTPLRTRFQDPGTAVLQLLARDVKAVAAAWKKAGGEVVTGGGEPVTMGALTLVVLRDPNNLMLEVISAP
jgi:predicted enzyme related to lactoylglutathione lyase